MPKQTKKTTPNGKSDTPPPDFIAEQVNKKKEAEERSLNISNAKDTQNKVSDIEFVGDGDTFKLLCKASSKKEKWMKSTKVMHVPGLGCVVQVTTQQGGQVAEALCFVPGARIHTSAQGLHTLVDADG